MEVGMGRPRKHPNEELVGATSLPFSFLRKTSAAKFLGVSLPTFYKYSKLPGFPAPFKLDVKTEVYDSRDLENWVKSQPRTGAA